MTIDEFIRRAQVSILDMTRVDAPTWGTWAGDSAASHWHVVIACEARRMHAGFHMGPAHVGPPTMAGVLDSLANEAHTFEEAEHDFRTWCEHYQYDPEDDGYRTMFAVVEQQTAALRELLGEQLYEMLLWSTGHK